MILYYLLAYTIGIISITLYSSYYFKTRKRVYLNIVIFDINFLAIVVVYVIYSYYLNFFIILLSDILCAALGFTLLHFAFSTINFKYRKTIEVLVIIVALILSVLTVVNERIASIVFSFLAISILLSMLILVEPFKYSSRESIGTKGRIIGIMSLLFLPVIILVDFFPDLNPFTKFFSGSFNSFPAFFILLNISLLIALKGAFWSKVRDFELVKKKFKLTDRELEVLILLVSAKSYKDIGEELCISMSTVKTHISKLYQKTACNNKVELISLIDS